jgi:hypothetical protein
MFLRQQFNLILGGAFWCWSYGVFWLLEHKSALFMDLGTCVDLECFMCKAVGEGLCGLRIGCDWSRNSRNKSLEKWSRTAKLKRGRCCEAWCRHTTYREATGVGAATSVEEEGVQGGVGDELALVAELRPEVNRETCLKQQKHTLCDRRLSIDGCKVVSLRRF